MEHRPTAAGTALEAAREAAGVSQEALAASLGISRTTYWRRVTGQLEFKFAEIRTVRRDLGLDLSPLL